MSKQSEAIRIGGLRADSFNTAILKSLGAARSLPAEQMIVMARETMLSSKGMLIMISIWGLTGECEGNIS